MRALLAALWLMLVISVTMGLRAGYRWGRIMAAAGPKLPGRE